jgi:hypothetical protein
MVETEMSLQSDFTNSKPALSSYSQVGTQEEENSIDPKDIQLGKYTKDNNEINNTILENSDQSIPITIDQKQNYFYKKLGNSYSFFGDVYGNPKIIIGPHWPLYAFVTFIFSLGFFSMIIFLGKYLPLFIKIVGFIVYFIFLFSYSYTALINPGYPKHDIDSETGEPRKKFYYCPTCKMYVSREKKTLHCSDCDICVEGLDHHCPWTGKCIGRDNLTSFYIFVISIFGLIVYFVFAMSSLDKESLFKRKKK